MITLLKRLFGHREEPSFTWPPPYRNEIFERTKRALRANSQYMAFIRENPDVEIMFPDLRDGP